MPDIRTEFKNLRQLGQELEDIQERISRLRSAMEGLNRVMLNSPDSHSVPTDKLAKQMAELDELQREEMALLAEHYARIHGLERRLEILPAPQRRVMELRYVKGLKWRGVAKAANLSESQCYRRHVKALKTLRKKAFQKTRVNASKICDKV
jgi:RNA polymerase sigma factor (sigma-70 family)